MHHFRILLIIGLIFQITTSCEKNENPFASTEVRIQGEWRYEKVKFSPHLSLNSTDLTGEYEGVTLNFRGDQTIERTNANSGIVESGSWRVETEILYMNENQYQPVEVLTASLVNFNNQEVTLINWRDLNIKRKKLTCWDYRDGGSYRYTLVRD